MRKSLSTPKKLAMSLAFLGALASSVMSATPAAASHELASDGYPNGWRLKNVGYVHCNHGDNATGDPNHIVCNGFDANVNVQAGYLEAWYPPGCEDYHLYASNPSASIIFNWPGTVSGKPAGLIFGDNTSGHQCTSVQTSGSAAAPWGFSFYPNGGGAWGTVTNTGLWATVPAGAYSGNYPMAGTPSAFYYKKVTVFFY